MFFINNFDIAILDGKFKHRYLIFAHELCRHSTASQTWKLLRTANDILLSLNYPVLITPPFGLYRHHELASVPINTNINLVDLDLSYMRHSRPEVILKGKGSNSQKHIYKPVIANLCQQRLLISKCILTNNFGGSIWYFDGKQLFTRQNSI